jgi:hypothetical protein
MSSDTHSSSDRMKYEVLFWFTYQRYGPLAEIAVGRVLLVVEVRVHGNTLLGRPETQTGIKCLNGLHILL